MKKILNLIMAAFLASTTIFSVVSCKELDPFENWDKKTPTLVNDFKLKEGTTPEKFINTLENYLVNLSWKGWWDPTSDYRDWIFEPKLEISKPIHLNKATSHISETLLGENGILTSVRREDKENNIIFYKITDFPVGNMWTWDYKETEILSFNYFINIFSDVFDKKTFEYMQQDFCSPFEACHKIVPAQIGIIFDSQPTSENAETWSSNEISLCLYPNGSFANGDLSYNLLAKATVNLIENTITTTQYK